MAALSSVICPSPFLVYCSVPAPAFPSAAQVVGDALKPHLEPLSASQMKLLTIYLDKARRAGQPNHRLA